MNMRNRTLGRIGLCCAISLVTTYSLCVANEPNIGVKERVVIEVTQQKNGCADCHKGKIQTPDGKEKDITLAGEVRNIPRHPQMDDKATLKVCMKCHGAGEQRIRFINKLHDVHLNSVIYVGEFKQTCSGCHDMRHMKGS